MSGKGYESVFEALFLRYGKQAYVYRIEDAADVFGRTGAFDNSSKPSDYIVTLDGRTAYCEVKSTENITRFKRSLIRTKQLAAARQQVAAGGDYWVFVYSIKKQKWFRIPASFIINSSKPSWTWEELSPYVFS